MKRRLPFELELVADKYHFKCLQLNEFFRNHVIYFLIGRENGTREVIYIGQTSNISRRINQHLSEKIKSFYQVYYFDVKEDEKDFIEFELINRFKPRYNICNGNNAKNNLSIKERLSLRVEFYDKIQKRI